MSLQVEQLEHNMAKLTIEVSAEELEASTSESIPETARHESCFRGFRKGKVPRQMHRKDVRTGSLL